MTIWLVFFYVLFLFILCLFGLIDVVLVSFLMLKWRNSIRFIVSIRRWKDNNDFNDWLFTGEKGDTCVNCFGGTSGVPGPRGPPGQPGFPGKTTWFFAEVTPHTA